VPRPDHALNMIRMSKGVLDFACIYEPFARKILSAKRAARKHKRS
jgi:hypothetical protein